MILKRQWLIQLIKENAKLESLTTDHLAFCRISLKYMKGSKYDQIYTYFDNFFVVKHQCGFRKGYNA